MIILAVLVMLIPGNVLSTGVPGMPDESEIIRAFAECPEIISAQKEFKGIEPGEIDILFYNSMFGTKGCQGWVLVAQKFSSRKANPMTRHLLGRVYVGTENEITRVERMVAVPYSEWRKECD